MSRIVSKGVLQQRTFLPHSLAPTHRRPEPFLKLAGNLRRPLAVQASAARHFSARPQPSLIMHSSKSLMRSLLVFGSGPTRLAFDALDVHRLVDSELWTGEPPLQLGTLLGIGEGAFERRTKVLELETSYGQPIPVLARGPMRLRTFDLSELEAVTVPQGHDPALVACVGGVFEEAFGSVQIYRILTDPLHHVHRRSGDRPSGRFSVPPFGSKRHSSVPCVRQTG